MQKPKVRAATLRQLSTWAADVWRLPASTVPTIMHRARTQRREPFRVAEELAQR